jgi:hypothetical protein
MSFEIKNSQTADMGGTITRTSLVLKYDGVSLTYITLPANPALNDVLSALNNAIGGLQAVAAVNKTSQITLYNGTLVTGQVSITANSTLNSVVVQLATYISANIVQLTSGGSSIAADGLTTYGLPAHDGSSRPTLTGTNPPVLPTGSYTGPLSPSIDTKPYNPTDGNIAGHLKGLATKLTFTDLSINERVDFEYLRNTLAQLFDNFIYSVSFSSSGASLIITVGASGYVSGRAVYGASTNVTTTADSDNYIDLTYAGVFVCTAVAISGGAPALAANSIRLYKVTTGDTGVTGSTDLHNAYPISNGYIAPNAIQTANILNANVTNAKLDTTAVSAGAYSFGNFTVNAQGRITSASSAAVVTAPANKDILWYNSGLGYFVNVPFVGNIIPSGSDQDIYIYNAGAGIITTKNLTTLLANIGQPLTVTVSLTAVQLATGNSVPIQAIAAPGAGLAIEVISASVSYTYSTAVYTATTMALITSTASANQAVTGTILSVGSSTFVKATMVQSASIQLIANKALMIQTQADGGAGAVGTAKVYICYRVITV